MRLFPVVGAVIGLAGGAVYAAAALRLAPIAAAALALSATTALTGALHEDGLADVADGFGGGIDRDAKLAIMRDSRLGTYGVTTLMLTLLLRAGALCSFSPWLGLGAMVATHALARAAIPIVMYCLPAARSDGLGVAAGTPTRTTAAVAFLLGCLFAVVALPTRAAVPAIAGAALGALAVSALAKRQIGGYTGDVLGAVEQAAESLALLFAAAVA
jgi:adenosylcobinamide-GDP ribazoletransferase